MIRTVSGKSTLILLLALMLMLTACAGNGGKTSPSNEGNKGTPEASQNTGQNEQNNEKQEITMFTDSFHDTWPYKEDWAVWDWIEEATGVRIKAEIAAPSLFTESLNLQIASNTLPDLVFVYGEINQLGQDGVFLNIMDYLDKMPNVKRFYEENPRIKQAVTLPEGEIYLLPRTGSDITDYRIWFNDKDIFEKHQLKQPETWQELYDASKQLKQIYPDSYPFIFRHGLGTLEVMAPSFGTSTSFYQDLETGDAKFGPFEEGYKTMIEWMHKFAQDELIPPDWLSMDYQQWLRYLSTNKGFITIQFIGQKETLNLQEGASWWEFMAPPEGVNGNRYTPNNFGLSGFGINANPKNLEGTLKAVDFMYSDEGMQILSWGKEGVTYDIVDGKKKYKDDIKQFTELRIDYGIMTQGSFTKFDPDALLALVNEKEQDTYKLAPPFVLPTLNIRPTFTQDELDIINQYLPSIQKHYDENIALFIMGQRPLSEWDNFIQELKNMKVDELVAMYQTGWSRQRQ